MRKRASPALGSLRQGSAPHRCLSGNTWLCHTCTSCHPQVRIKVYRSCTSFRLPNKSSLEEIQGMKVCKTSCHRDRQTRSGHGAAAKCQNGTCQGWARRSNCPAELQLCLAAYLVAQTTLSTVWSSRWPSCSMGSGWVAADGRRSTGLHRRAFASSQDSAGPTAHKQCLTSMAAMNRKALGCSEASATRPGPGQMPPSPAQQGQHARAAVRRDKMQEQL